MMKSFPSKFILPTKVENAVGNMRTVGFELEFSGITLHDTVKAVSVALDGTVEEETVAEVCVKSDIGEFNVEVDWHFLKRTAADAELADGPGTWLQQLSKAAALLVPIEVVCPPIPMTSIDQLDGLVDALQKAGAVGTEESLIAAYGVHINPEIPALDAATINRYLRAFVLLQWWLVEANSVELARRVSPYIDLFDEPYIKRLLTRDDPCISTLINDYLNHNPTRNRALDMLPMFAHIDAGRVRATVNDPKIKSRPTFHYRLPNCCIDDPEWSLASSWNLWCVVEKLADDEASLTALSKAFLAEDRPLLGVNRTTWVDRIKQWIDGRV
jgi:hypothetical protein